MTDESVAQATQVFVALLGQRAPRWPVVRVSLRVRRPDAGIEEQQSPVRADQVTENRLDPGLRSAGLRAGPDEVPEVKPADGSVLRHPLILAVRYW